MKILITLMTLLSIHFSNDISSCAATKEFICNESELTISIDEANEINKIFKDKL